MKGYLHDVRVLLYMFAPVYAVLGIASVWPTSACTRQEAKQAAVISAETCVELASEAGRADIATVCGIAEDLANLLLARRATRLDGGVE